VSGTAVAGTGDKVVNIKAATMAAALSFLMINPPGVFRICTCYSSVFLKTFGKRVRKFGLWPGA
jgi:hypothetical protein